MGNVKGLDVYAICSTNFLFFCDEGMAFGQCTDDYRCVFLIRRAHTFGS